MSGNNLEPNKVLIFDIKGPMAHFRKYYTNSSSLSYMFPPRTVITGLIAGLLGVPSERFRSENEKIFYEQFDSINCFVAISIRSKIRKMMQTLNYYNVEIKNKSLRYQIPVEILLPIDANQILYRIYFFHSDEQRFNALKERLEKRKYCYPPYLGISEFLASIDYVGEGTIAKNPNKKVELNRDRKSVV